MIDNVGLKLIENLQKNGRDSYADLAKKLGVVEGTVRKRTKRLLEDEVIKVVAVPNMEELGYSITAVMAFQVRMDKLRTVADILAQNQHVCYLAFVAGRYDLMAIVLARSPQELSYLIEREVSPISGVQRTETFINLDTIKGTGGLLDTNQLIRNSNTSLVEKLGKPMANLQARRKVQFRDKTK